MTPSGRAFEFVLAPSFQQQRDSRVGVRDWVGASPSRRAGLALLAERCRRGGALCDEGERLPSWWGLWRMKIARGVDEGCKMSSSPESRSTPGRARDARG